MLLNVLQVMVMLFKNLFLNNSQDLNNNNINKINSMIIIKIINKTIHK